MPSKSKEIIGQAGMYSFAFVLTQLINVLGALIIRRFLGPLQTGVWALVQVIAAYTDYCNIGATYSIPVEIPFLRAQGKSDMVEQMKNTIFSFSFLTSLVYASGITVFAIVQRSSLLPQLFWGLMITAGLVILQQINNILVSLVRCYKEFSLASKLMVISAIVNLFLVSFFSYFFKLYGFMIGMIISFIFNILFVLNHRNFHFAWEIDPGVLKRLIAFGFPLMILTFLNTTFLAIDRIMIAKFLGLEQLGYYSIAVMTVGFIYGFPNAIGVVLLPNVSEKYAERQQMKDLSSYLIRSNQFFSFFMPIIIGIAWFLVPLVIRLVIPEFTAGIPALRCLAISAFFLALTQTYTSFIVVIKRHFIQLPLAILSCLLAVVANFIALSLNGGITGIAMATTFVMFLHFLIMFGFSGQFVFSWKELLGQGVLIARDFICMLIIFFCLINFVHHHNYLLQTLMHMVLLALIYFPFAVHANKKFGIGSVLKEKFQKRFIWTKPEESIH